MTDPPIDPSVFQEPHLTSSRHTPDPSEKVADRNPPMHSLEADLADQSVFDEPSYSGSIPEGALTYWKWIENKTRETTFLQSLGMTFLLAFAAGPWAVLGAIAKSGSLEFQGVPQLIGICIVVPTIEEVMKLAAALYVVERRPFYFKSSWQILVCAFAGGLVFGVIENLLYLNWYLEDPTPFLKAWRWTVCTTLHVSCTTLAGFGLVRVWRDHRINRRKPDLTLAFPFLAAAMTLHGTYNLFASFFWMAGFEF